MQLHEKYMQRALDLALLGKGKVAPNPLVGCVIVHEEKIIGEGYHRKFGEAHAEPNALASVVDRTLLPKSTIYVTLEPCSHYGKTPPCADAIIKSGIKKVIIANQDPFKEVSGSGIKKMRLAGIDVITGILEKEGEELNKRFFTFHRKKRPYVILKWAQTTDGFVDRIREKTEAPLKISNTENSALVHQWRSEESAILVGMNTVRQDNPSLTVRKVEGKNPIRITIDSKNDNAPFGNSNLFDGKSPTLVYTLQKKENRKNLEYIQLTAINLNSILNDLHSRNIQSLIVEGGSKLLNEFILSNLWDEARVSSSNQIIDSGILAPRINGALKDEFVCGNNCIVSVFSPSLI